MKPLDAEANVGRLLAAARRSAQLSQAELARRAGTSRTAISAYEHGSKSPSTDTAVRILAAAGFVLEIQPRAQASAIAGRGRVVTTVWPLPRLPIERALGLVELPLGLNWSEPGRQFDLTDRGDRARLYEIVLREGDEEDLRRYVDGVLLVDLWDELVLPRAVRAAWAPVMGSIRRQSATADAS